MQTFDEFLKSGSSSVAEPTSSGLPSFGDYLKTAPPVESKPSLLSRLVSSAKSYAQESADTVTNTVNAVKHPWDTVQKIPSVFMDSFMKDTAKAGSGLYDLVTNVKPNSIGIIDLTNPKIAAAASKVFTGTVGAALTPITGLFHIASQIPGLKQAADVLNLPLTGLGYGVDKVNEKAFQYLVDKKLISPETADTLKQPIGEAASLTAQLLLGEKIMKKVEAHLGEGKPLTENDANQIAMEVKGEATAQSQTVPTFQEFVQSEPKKTILPEQRPVETTPQLPQEVGAGEQVPNSRAQTLEAAAVEKKLTEGLGDLPTHEQMSMADQANKSVDFIDSNKDLATKVALGDELPPQGILPESIYTALEIKAMKEGDIELMQRLAQSKIPTAAGQALKALDSVDPYSPVKIMRDVEAARQAKIEKVNKKKATVAKAEVVKEIKEKIPKVTKQVWSDFVESIKCNY